MIGFSQNAKPIIDLNSPIDVFLDWTNYVGDLDNPFGTDASLPDGGWTRNNTTHVQAPQNANILFSQDNPPNPLFAISPTISGMNLGPTSTGGARLLVGLYWNQGLAQGGPLSGSRNTFSIYYDDVEYARLRTDNTTNNPGTGDVFFQNGAKNAEGTTASKPIPGATLTTLHIELPKNVASTGKVRLQFNPRDNGRDDVRIAFIRAHKYTGDSSYNFNTTYIENGTPVALANSDMEIVDDGTNLASATITTTNPQTGDVLSISGTLPAGISATFNADNTIISLTGSAPVADYITAIKQVRFANTSENPNTTTRAINVVVTDSDGVSSDASVASVTVLAVNDAPMGTDKTVSVVEDGTYTFSAADFGFSDPAEAHEFAALTLATLPANGTLKLNGTAVTADQVVPVMQIPQLTWQQNSENANGNAFDSFTFKVTDNGGTANGGVNTDPSANTITINVTAEAELSVNKTASNNSPDMGSNVIFTITITNTGPSNATGVKVNDLLPTGYAFVSATEPAGTSYNSTSGEWLIGNLADDANSVLTITATVKASGNYANTATVSANEYDPIAANNSASVTLTPVAVANLSVTKTVNNSTPDVNSEVTFTITAANAGPVNATGVEVIDQLPSGYTYVSASFPAGTNYNNSNSEWTIGNLAKDANVVLTITAIVKASGDYENTATVSANEKDPSPADNTASVTPMPVAIANMSVTKIASSNTPHVGSQITFAVTAANAGPSNATNVKVDDLLPNGYTFVSASTPAGTTYDKDTGKWLIGNLPNGSNFTLIISATVNASGDYENIATVSASETDSNEANNTDRAKPVPVPVANVSVTKSASSNTPNVGSNVTFTVTATNAGPSNATNVTVTDELPTGYTFVSAVAPTGTNYDEATGIWTIGALANGANSVLTITATVNASGEYRNTASATLNESDPDTENNTDAVTPVPVPRADVSVNKISSNNMPDVGSHVTFTITAANAGPSTATNVEVTDLLPNGYTFVSASTPVGTSYNSVNGVWSIGNLARDENSAFTITATVNASGKYENTASVRASESDPNPGNNTKKVTPVPVHVSNVAVSKTADNSMPNVGSNVTFTITASNAGPSLATDVIVNDLLPNGYTYLSSSASGTTTYNAATGVWTVGNLANSSSAVLTINARVNVSGNYTNTASIGADEKDPDETDNSDAVTLTPAPVADLAIAKTVNNTNPAFGNNVVFTVTVNNTGPSNATMVSVTDALPSGYTFASAAAPAGTSYNNTTGIWTIGNLANGASAVLTITATVNVSGDYSNVATVTRHEHDPNETNNSASSTPFPSSSTDLSVTKTASNNSPTVGTNVTFTITANNAGPSNATNVSVTDALPTGYSFVSAAAPAGTTYNSTMGVWAIGNLASGTNKVLNITATVNGNGNRTNTANISGSQSDPNNTNNTASITLTPVASADLAVSKTASSNAPKVGSDVIFTIIATNAGLSGASNVSVDDLLPDGYAFVSATPSGGTNYDDATGLWTIGNLASEASATLSVTATVLSNGNYTNTATIKANEDDPDLSNNTTTSTPVPVPVANMSVTKTIDNNTPNVGSLVTFAITASNEGPSNATAVKVTDALPSGYTFMSATPATGTTYDSDTGEWLIGALDNGHSAVLTISAIVNATGNYSNIAVINAAENDPGTANNMATATSTPVPVADLSVTKTVSDNTPNVGSEVTFTITAANTGPSSATNVRVNDALPNGYSFVSASAPAGTNYNSNTGLWTIGNLANGANTVLTVNATVNASGNYTNTATIHATENDPGNINNTATVTPGPVSLSDVSVTKTVSDNMPDVGSEVIFTITASNAGPSQATNVSVNDLLPNGYTFVSATASGTTNYNPTTGIWSIGNLANGSDITLSIIASVQASGNYTNTATIQASETDPANTNNMASSTPVPVAVSNLSVSKTVSNPSPGVGSNVTFTVTVSNAGPSEASNVKVKDLLPDGYAFVSASAPAGTMYDQTTGDWMVGILANGANSVLTITATVNADGNYSNTATASSTEKDPNNTGNTDTITPVPTPVADLSVTKTSDSNAPNVGSNVIFTITALNTGPSNATNVRVTDALPNGYTFVSASAPGGTTYNNFTGIWTVGNLASGASTVLTITAHVNASGNRTNTATINAAEHDPDRANNSATIKLAPVPVVDVEVSKTINNNRPDVGSNINFTVTASNKGPSTATNVKVNDLLPSGYTFVSASAASGTTYNSTTGVWMIGNLTNGSIITLNITATVKNNGDYTNTATIAANEHDSDNSNNTSSITPVPVPVANLTVTKTADNNKPDAGSNITFTITAANAGPSNATNVNVNDLLPDGYTFVSVTAPAGTSYNNTTGLWAIGNLASGANAVLTITATVNASGNYSNTATITGNEDPDGSPSATVTPTPRPTGDVSVTKMASNDAPNVGSNVTFTVTANNAGPSNASHVTVNDRLPTGYTFVSASAPAGTMYDSNTGIWSVNNLANGATSVLTITATVNASGNYNNRATIQASENDPNTENNMASNTPNAVALANVSVNKTVSHATPDVGSNVTFTVTAGNAGPSKATNVKVVDLLPSGYTYLSASIPAGTAYDNSTGEWLVGLLANGANKILTITASVNTSGNYSNTATITASELDLDESDNSFTVTPVPEATADLQVIKTSNGASSNVGDDVTFKITARNMGPSAATQVRVDDLLPSGFTFVSATPATGTTYDHTTGEWIIGNLATSANITLSIVATINATGNHTNTAVISAKEKDLNPGNNTSSVVLTPGALADIALTKTVDNPTPVVGENIIFKLTATSNGPSALASNVRVNDVLPSGYTFISASATLGTYNHNTGIWTIGNLANGSHAILDLTVTVNPGGNYINTATISLNETDPDDGNNTATATATPVPESNVSVTKTVNNDSPGVGSNIAFTITASNAGPSIATNVIVTDVLPDGYTFLSASAPTGTTYNPENGVWMAGNLGNGANTILTITAKVNVSGDYSNTATIKADENDPDNSNNSATAIPAPTAVVDLSVTKSVSNNTPVVGSHITFTIIAANAGPSNASNVIVRDALPDGYTFLSASAPAGTSYDHDSGQWIIGNLTNGFSMILTIDAIVNATGDYTNTAAITANEDDPHGDNNFASAGTTPRPSADLSVTKTASNNTPNVGTQVTFTITATNAGPSHATNARVTDVLPNGYTFLSASAPTGTNYNQNTGIWTIGSMVNGTKRILTITATVNASGNYANTATITANENDVNEANNTATASLSPVAVADVRINKAGNLSPKVGEKTTFIVLSYNNGPSNATGVYVKDLLPSGYTFLAASQSAGTSYDSTTGVWTIENLANGDSLLLVIDALVNPTGNYTNTATIAANELDPNHINNTDAVTPNPVAVANMSIIKTVNKSNPGVGSSVIFTLTAKNLGISTATNVKVNDLLPDGYTFLSASAPMGTTYDNTTGVWTIGNMVNKGSAVLTIHAKVNASGNYVNTATITANEEDPNGDNNSATVTTTPTALADVAVVKTASSTTPEVGETITFTITASNAGPSTANNVIVNDALPSGYHFISAAASGSTSYNSSTGAWLIGNLTNGASATLSVTARVNSTGNYTNTATIRAKEDDPDHTSNTATFTPTPVPVADVAVSKTVNNARPAIGSLVTFTIYASNTGPGSATNVLANDKLPDGYTFISSTTSAGTIYDAATGLWRIGNLANGASAILTITARVNASGSYANTATISATEKDSNMANNSSASTPVPTAVADVMVNKAVSANTPIVGSNVTFSITASNAGPSTATAVKVDDLLPSGYTFVSAVAPVGTTYNQTTGVWNIGTLANGKTMRLSITAKVNTSGDYVNKATVLANETDVNASNNTAVASTSPISTADVSITKKTNEATPNVGSNITFTINVLNSGPSTATNVVVTDVLPAGYTFISSDNKSYNAATGIWTVGDIVNGASKTLEIVVKVNAAGNYANRASVTASENDPNMSNNATTTVPVPIPVPVADIAVSKTVDDSRPNIGALVKFSVSVSNLGPSTATNVVAADLLPNGYTFVSAIPSGNTTYDSATGIWKIGTLANGTSTVITIDAKVNAKGNYTNTATAKATAIDLNMANNTAAVTTVPQNTADLSVHKTVDNVKPVKETNVIFSIKAKNAGPGNASAVTVTDLLPDGFSFISANAPAGTSYDATAGVWTIGDLPNGADITLTITAEVNLSGTYTNIAIINSVTADPNLVDNISVSTVVPSASIKNEESPKNLKIPNLFTPNGDGTNDTFEIRNLKRIQKNELTIINKWGNEVYRSNNYQNNWTGEGLNEGTYFYLLKVKETESAEWVIYKGWLTLLRSFR
ncbi:DUF11 domain-containing protein [Pedobacter endophyticus]|uniref:DUF11 domain-containing protein n=2 Tax=Pedobacter endophyticus TaxID=2789740 RepID=A0A7S9KYP3_9SPHI|nr:DUF11 domain-containing protein [Pedobacter endophyticus]